MRKSDSNSYELWLDFINHKPGTFSKFSTPNLKQYENNKINTDDLGAMKNETNSKMKHYKTPEEYYDDIILFKKDIVRLKGENDILKSKLRKSEEILNKKDKELKEVIQCFENPNIIRDVSVNNYVLIKKLQQNIFQMKSEIKDKENEILTIKSETRCVKINELKLQNELYLQEIRSLKQVNTNFQYSKLNNSNDIVPRPSGGKSSRSLPLHEKYKALVKKNKEILIENKLLKEEKHKLKQNELLKEEAKFSRKNDESADEINRLKALHIKLIDEKSEMQSKLEVIMSENKNLQKENETKSKECEELRKKIEKMNNSKEVQRETKAKEIDKITPTENKNLPTVGMSCLAYLNRQKILDNSSIHEYPPNSKDMVLSAAVGFMLREKHLKL